MAPWFGQWVTGTFTANAGTQLVTVTATSSSGFSTLSVINAAQLRTVPEPGVLNLFGVVGGLLLFIRHRRRV